MNNNEESLTIEKRNKNIKKIIVVIICLVIGIIIGLIISKKSIEEKVVYEKSEYTCKIGETIETEIKIIDGEESTVIEKFGLDNELVASIVELEKKGDGTRKVQITCKNMGEANLTAETNSGKTTTSKLLVTEKDNIISFEKDSYTCIEGETITTYVTGDYISGFTSSDDIIAEIKKSSNNENVEIKCKRMGHVDLTITSSDGKTSVVPLQVESKNSVVKPTITASITPTPIVSPSSKPTTNEINVTFEKDIYTCKKGETIITYVNGGVIDMFSSSNPSIVEISKSRVQDLKCPCTKIEIKCVASGTVKVEATLSDNKGIASVNVE